MSDNPRISGRYLTDEDLPTPVDGLLEDEVVTDAMLDAARAVFQRHSRTSERHGRKVMTEVYLAMRASRPVDTLKD